MALHYRLNANLLRRWVVAARQHASAHPAPDEAQPPPTAAFVPLQLQAPVAAIDRGEICIEVRRVATITLYCADAQSGQRQDTSCVSVGVYHDARFSSNAGGSSITSAGPTALIATNLRPRSVEPGWIPTDWSQNSAAGQVEGGSPNGSRARSGPPSRLRNSAGLARADRCQSDCLCWVRTVPLMPRHRGRQARGRSCID